MGTVAARKNFKLKGIEDALEMSDKELERNYKEFINPYFLQLLKLLKLNKRFKKAKGIKLWDTNGEEYFDFLGAYGAINLGHNNEDVIRKVNMIRETPNLIQTAIQPLAAILAENLAMITPGDLKYTFFCNSGAEAVEGALKLAKIATGKHRIIYCKGSFHGKSLGALSVTGREKYKKHYGPMVPMNTEVEYGDITELRNAINYYDDIAAFIFEPIQGEGGIITPPEGYLKEASELCRDKKIILIADEVQTGFGRTGYWFACEKENIVPDILCMAKSLGGGIMPMGAYIANKQVWKKGYGSLDKCLLHTSTFGGNAWGCAAAIATIEVIQEEELELAAMEKGEYFISQLKSLMEKHNILVDVRGQGLMIGLEFRNASTSNRLINNLLGSHNEMLNEYFGGMIASELANKYRIITAYTLNNPNVIRVEPPLTLTYSEIDYFVESLESVLKNFKGLSGMTIQTAKNLFAKIDREA
ncbi:aspartate aminotransferase family protein [Alkaliphilus peptidifermentans]|uniref:Putrescine aminotransferase n=1 Tax=Alkaliphilus peptidifermentans DSM 18978 TaxID=1120976 RepID=A0A1G5KQ79_9FIRM|nr:aspartate aminotransferase family protein [Alkaliphilus peptidifermentans]SCZ02745.1 putrescine aminotransferase [Alkaliphilus peptidifermentans DSM 18978]